LRKIKAYSAKVFPNAIDIGVKSGTTYHFNTFLERDKAFNVLTIAGSNSELRKTTVETKVECFLPKDDDPKSPPMARNIEPPTQILQVKNSKKEPVIEEIKPTVESNVITKSIHDAESGSTERTSLTDSTTAIDDSEAEPSLKRAGKTVSLSFY